MARRLIESLSGTGPIHAGDVLLRTTHYDLSLWADDQSPSGTVATIDGHIDITGIAEAAVLSGTDTLVLTVEDGRRLAFQLTSSGGGIIARGWVP